MCTILPFFFRFILLACKVFRVQEPGRYMWVAQQSKIWMPSNFNFNFFFFKKNISIGRVGGHKPKYEGIKITMRLLYVKAKYWMPSLKFNHSEGTWWEGGGHKITIRLQNKERGASYIGGSESYLMKV